MTSELETHLASPLLAYLCEVPCLSSHDGTILHDADGQEGADAQKAQGKDDTPESKHNYEVL